VGREIKLFVEINRVGINKNERGELAILL